MSAQVNPEGGEAPVIKNDKSDIKLWISCIVTAIVFLAVGFALPSGAEGVGSSYDPVNMIKSFFQGGGIGMALHSGFVPIFMWKKKKDLIKEASKPVEQTTFTADGKTMIYARKMTICQKIISILVGTLLAVIGQILSIVAMVGPDFRVLFFPLPFYNFWKSKMLVSNMRIKGAKLRLKATYSDAYFLWLKISRNNLYTCGCYGKRCNKLGYEKWLDKRLSWAGTPPPSFTDEFVIFAVRASLCERLQLALMKFCFGLVLSACAPFTQPYLLLKLYQFELKHMVIGGKTPFFDADMTYKNMLKTFFISCCGCRKAVIWKFVDSQINFDMGGAVAPGQQEMTREP